jgi:hypothetical protein
MNGGVFRYKFSDLDVTARKVEKFIGYKDGEDSSVVREMIEIILAEAEDISEVRAEYRVYPILNTDSLHNQLLIGNTVFELQKIVFSQLKKAEYAALFLCTAGTEIGRRSRVSMSEKDLLRGYVYDVVGSEIAEAAADLLQNQIKKDAAKSGFNITNRYSPGYCGWNVSEQHKLFKLMPYNFCGIRLTESALMDPVKSVSGIIGIGGAVRMNKYTCNVCDMDDCIYRRLRE